MKELRSIAALNGTFKRVFIVTGAGIAYSFISSSFATADDVIPSTPSDVAPMPSSGQTSAVDATIQTIQTSLDASVSGATPYQLDQNTVVLADAQLAINAAVTASVIASSATADVATAQAVVDAASTDLSSAQAVLSETNADITTQQDTVTTATASVSTAESAVATETQNVTDAQAAKDAAQAVVDAATSPGLAVTVYSDPAYGARPPVGAGTIVNQGVVANVDFNWGSGRVMGGPSDRVQVNFVGQFTPNQTGTMWLTPQADDGTILTIGGLTINNWVDKGGGGGTLTLPVTAGVPQSFNLWYYENGGGAFVQLLYYTGSGWQVVPASAFSQSSATPAQIAALSTATSTLAGAIVSLNAANEILANAQVALSTEQQTLTNLQVSQTTAQATVLEKQTIVDDAVSNLITKQTLAEITNATALSLSQTATDKVTAAVDAVAQTPLAPAPPPSPQPQPVPYVPTPVAPDVSPATPDTTTSSTDTSTPSDSQTGATDVTPAPSTTPTDSSSGTGSSTTSQSTSQVTQNQQSQSNSNTSAVPSTSPNSLPDTVPLVPAQDQLVAHVQQDIAGAQNGGIEFFGTKSQPQVIGEDGKLTPPPPPPGSGLPIPPEAITVAATFIGQPGGTTFNAPDVAVPVAPIVVTVPVPGAQALADAYVAMANIGNDMSPVTRKKAKKILVTTVVLGQIISLRRRLLG